MMEWEQVQEFPTDRPVAHHDIDSILGAGKMPVCDESGLVRRVIDFANGETDVRRLLTDAHGEDATNQNRESARRLLRAAAGN